MPPGGVEGAVQRVLSGLKAPLESDARDLLRTPEAPLWALGSADEEGKRRATEELLKDLLSVGFERVLTLLSQRVDEAARRLKVFGWAGVRVVGDKP